MKQPIPLQTARPGSRSRPCEGRAAVWSNLAGNGRAPHSFYQRAPLSGHPSPSLWLRATRPPRTQAASDGMPPAPLRAPTPVALPRWSRNAQQYGSLVAVEDPHHPGAPAHTYAEINQLMLDFGAGLRSLGLEAGDRVRPAATWGTGASRRCSTDVETCVVQHGRDGLGCGEEGVSSWPQPCKAGRGCGIEMEWNGVERSGMDWNGTEREERGRKMAMLGATRKPTAPCTRHPSSLPPGVPVFGGLVALAHRRSGHHDGGRGRRGGRSRRGAEAGLGSGRGCSRSEPWGTYPVGVVVRWPARRTSTSPPSCKQTNMPCTPAGARVQRAGRRAALHIAPLAPQRPGGAGHGDA
mgnify:CR=1 FL=1